jgi:peptidyl-prolyl cis-trans isomerase D
MFEFLRKGATSIFAKIFLAVIVIVFVFWGIGPFTGDRSQVVAEISGEKITAKEFREYYNYQLYQLKLAFGEGSQEIAKDPKFKEEVLFDLIRKRLLRKYAESLGLSLSEKEVEMYLAQIPAFQDRGAFNPAKYQTLLREVGVTPKFFEGLLKQDLLEQRLSSLLNSALFTTKKEAEDFSKFYFQTLHFKLAELPYSSCAKELKPTDSDLENFFLTRRDLYTEEEKVKLVYHFLPFKGKAEVSEKEIKDYYEKNLTRFKEPFKVKLREIFIEGTDQSAFTKAQSLRAEIQDLKDFAKHKSISQWYDENSLPPELRNLIKSAKPGLILGPLKVEGGYLIVGVEEISPERLLKLDEVKSRIISELKQEKIKANVIAKANELYTKVVKEDGLTNLYQKEGIKLEETPYLTKKELLNLIQGSQTVDKVFKEKKGAYLPPVQTPKGVFLIEIKDKKEKRNLEFSEVKEKVKEDYLKEKGKSLCEDKAKSLIALVKKGEDFVKTAQAKGFKILGSTVKRKDFDPQIGLSKDLKLGIIEEPRVLEDRTQVLYLERVENPANLKPEEISLAKEAFISLKKEVIQRALFKDLQDKKNIKIYPLFKQL